MTENFRLDQHDQQIRRLEERSPKIYDDVQRALGLAVEARQEVAVLAERIPSHLGETLTRLVTRVESDRDAIDELKTSCNRIADRVQVLPLLQKLVFGLVGTVLTSFIGALLYLILTHAGTVLR